MHGYESITSYGFHYYRLAFKEPRAPPIQDVKLSPAVARCDVSRSRRETMDSQSPFK